MILVQARGPTFGFFRWFLTILYSSQFSPGVNQGYLASGLPAPKQNIYVQAVKLSGDKLYFFEAK
jgi:hypothetical protein